MKFLIILITIIFNIYFNQRVYSQEIKQNNSKQNISKIYTNIYDRPYSFFDSQLDTSMLLKDIGFVFGASVVGVGILYLLPESTTNWDKSDIKLNTLFDKWWEHVKEGPVIDHDDWFLNWITHPYWGAVYYMSARSAGANAPYSFLFSVIASTFFWEYGVEAFAEVPSIQDLIITPVVGSIIGEGFYLSKRHILANNYKLLNSKILGHTTLFLIDPITEVINLFVKDKKKTKDLSVISYPIIDSSKNIGYRAMITLKF